MFLSAINYGLYKTLACKREKPAAERCATIAKLWAQNGKVAILISLTLLPSLSLIGIHLSLVTETHPEDC